MNILLNAFLGFGYFIIDNWIWLSGIIMPSLINFLNKDVHREEEKYIVALLATFTIALILKFNAFAKVLYGSPTDFSVFFLTLFIESNSVYHLYFKTSFIRAKLQGNIPNTPTESGVSAP